MSELVSVAQAQDWTEPAQPHWPQVTARALLRSRWNGLLGRLRDRVWAGGVRTDLVSSTRITLVDLVFHEGDEVNDWS